MTLGSDYTLDATQAVPESGFAWILRLPDGSGPGDGPEAAQRSALRLFEDGNPLGPPHARHAIIRQFGGGAYSHWGAFLYFSASDNSDPRSNLRTYVLRDVAHDEGRFPSIVGLEIINACNARCPFCPLFQGAAMMDRAIRPAMIMDAELFERCVAEIAGWSQIPGALFLNMDGEPLQDPHFVARLHTIARYKLGPLVQLQTNGQFLRPRMAEAILAAKVGQITIGFDGATKATYERHRVRCNYERVLNNIRSFVTLRDAMGAATVVCIQYVRTKDNAHEVKDAYDLFARFLAPGRDLFHDNFAKDWGDSGGAEDYFYWPKRSAPLAHGCPTFDAQLIVHSDGTVAACCWDYNLRVSNGGFGNARDQSMLAIWRGSARQALADKFMSGDVNALPPKCRDCPTLTRPAQLDRSLAKITDQHMSIGAGGFMYRY